MTSGHERVVLLPGLGRTGRSLGRMAAALRAVGYATEIWRYAARRQSLTSLVAQFSAHLGARTGGGDKLHFVGHSLGGLIVRGALAAAERGANYEAFAPGRLVMLAPPNRGVGLIGRLGGGTMAELVFGRPVRDLGVGAAALENLGAPGLEVGVIAGNRRFHALNPISYVQALVGSEESHDGTVEVSRTRFDGMTDFTVVAAHHTFICDHPQVIGKTVRFLRSGRFDDEPQDVEKYVE
ncbi:MAG: alpha/beta fold hydrolase [Alphaproteobacteria bacterium]|nr:hypothetical protein [Rhodospirillaceae bacterium]MDP6405295.1 alpha/beta fold hydrolase [Alphaproteobacteria bacterium]MDP6624126.1 alpha/beta fold hydrolase [Alphaproteobacteria bacterium]